MIKLTCVSKELLEEIIEKLGSFAIASGIILIRGLILNDPSKH